jgi:hypothetical protein
MNGRGNHSPPFGQPAENVDHMHGSRAVKPRCRLVKKQDGRVDDELVANGGALALPTRYAAVEKVACRRERRRKGVGVVRLLSCTFKGRLPMAANGLRSYTTFNTLIVKERKINEIKRAKSRL